MGLYVESITLRERVGELSRFPGQLRCDIFRAVEEIPDLERFAGKNEADADSLDRCIERNLRRIAPALTINRDRGVSDKTKFHSDLVIEGADGASVCVEIEKGNYARFELDILKMQVFSAGRKRTCPNGEMFGALIVPSDNKVSRSITGASRHPESSFKYLKRLAPLVAEIKPLAMEDVLIVGYQPSPPDEKSKVKRVRGKKGKVRRSDQGLLPEGEIEKNLPRPVPEWVSWLRRQLERKCPELCEGFNPAGTPYLSYARGDSSYAIHPYLQMQRLKIDIDVQPSDEKTEELRAHGFLVEPRQNFQARKGWVTGWVVPYDTSKRDVVLQYFLEALKCQ